MEQVRAQFLEAVRSQGSQPIPENLKGRTEIATGKLYMFVPCTDGRVFWAYVDSPSEVSAV